MNLNVEKMRQFLEDFRNNDPEFSEKILDALRHSLSDNPLATLFRKVGNRFYKNVAPDIMFPSDGYYFIVPADWADHCNWISFDEDEDGNEIIMCPSEDPENPHVVYNFYELWDKVLDYYDFDIDTEIERIVDYWEKGYTNR